MPLDFPKHESIGEDLMGRHPIPGVNPVFDAAIPSIMYFKNTNTTTAKGLNGAAMNAFLIMRL
jgi:hypothetical protein